RGGDPGRGRRRDSDGHGHSARVGDGLMDTESRRLTSALNSTPTGQGLLNGALVMPSTDSARTDTVGVPRGAVNLYRDGTQLVLQAFDFDSGAWRSTRLGTGGAIVAWDDITGKPTEFPPEA